ncbi:hypothetical protein MXB_500, partial [Myxobolus squamalis]
IEKMFEWVTENGGDISKIKLDSSTSNFGLLCTENLEPQSNIIAIPKKIIIIANDFLTHKALIQLVSSDPILSSMPNLLMTYGLLIEFYRGEDPSFRDALSLWKGVVRQYAYFHLKIIEIAQTPDSTEKNEFLEKLNLSNRFCYEDYRWAVATVLTRAHTVQTSALSDHEIALIPVVDLCQHADTISSLDYNLEEQFVHLSNAMDLHIGDLVPLFYGARTNGQFVINFGFLYDDNIHDFITLKFLFDQDSKFVSQKHTLLLKLGLSEHMGIPINNTFDNVWKGDLVPFMRIYVANEEDISIIQSIPDEEFRQIIYDKKPISQTNEEDAKSTFIKILQAKIDICVFSTAENEKMDDDDESKYYKKHMIIKLIKSEAQIMKSALDCLLRADIPIIKAEESS